mgnify:CR=1 FL=1
MLNILKAYNCLGLISNFLLGNIYSNNLFLEEFAFITMLVVIYFSIPSTYSFLINKEFVCNDNSKINIINHFESQS